MSPTVPLSASLEDYLEAIFHIVAQKKTARVKDISKRLAVNYSSVTGALHSLAERDLVNYAPYELVTLTPKGKTTAREVVRRHTALRDFLVKVLFVEQQLADGTACKMEHVIPRHVIDRCIRYVDFVETCPHSGVKSLKEFAYRCLSRTHPKDCESCLSLSRQDVEGNVTGRKDTRGK